jgi:chemotaxis protein methyltransferase CheR
MNSVQPGGGRSLIARNSVARQERELRALEMRALLDCLYHAQGVDLRGLPGESLMRRCLSWLALKELNSLSEAQGLLLRDPQLLDDFLHHVTISVTEFFRDPEYFELLRTQVFAYLATFPRINIWDAGCSTGEEAYSLAILLREAGLWPRVRLYATDINSASLERAFAGAYDPAVLEQAQRAYCRAGGKASFLDYFRVEAGQAVIDPAFRERMLFAYHDLNGDEVFGEMSLVLCRNVLIYFSPVQQARAQRLFDRSLRCGGRLMLGSAEALMDTGMRKRYAREHLAINVFRKCEDVA